MCTLTATANQPADRPTDRPARALRIRGGNKRFVATCGVSRAPHSALVLVCLSFPVCPLRPGYIAGVTNPIFEQRNTWWDLLCNITNGTVTFSPAYAEELAAGAGAGAGATGNSGGGEGRLQSVAAMLAGGSGHGHGGGGGSDKEKDKEKEKDSKEKERALSLLFAATDPDATRARAGTRAAGCGGCGSCGHCGGGRHGLAALLRHNVAPGALRAGA